MTTRGIRGATTINSDTRENVLAATRELLDAILVANPGLNIEDIASAIFTTTEDIVSAFPALAARQMGWDQVPMINAREIPVSKSLPLCIRVLISWNTDKKQNAIRHIYLWEAVNLRPDLAPNN
ncbi:MAG: chorismate mutase [Anaerolineales bacterium]|nr:chorismate mutase [Anaerolineales bacterium]